MKENKTIVYLKQITKLALPIVISYLAMAIMGIVDTMVVGKFETEQLAYMGLSNAIFAVLFTVPMGLLQGVVIKSSQKYGAKKFKSCGKIYNEGKKYLIYLSIIFTFIGLNAEFLLTSLGQNPEMVKNSTPILTTLAFSVPFILIYANANFFLQSIKRPQIAMYGIISANIINYILDYILVFGLYGFPEMGAKGAALTTLVVRIFLAFYMLFYIHKMKKNTKINKRFGLHRTYDTWWNDSKSTRKIGYGVALIIMVANGSFSLVNIFAGWLGADIMATFVIIINTNGLIFMMMFAVSQAASILAANAYGKKDLKGFANVVKASYILSLGIMLCLQLLIHCFSYEIFGAFTNDPKVLAIIHGILFSISMSIFIDSLPLNITASLNGRGDIKVPTINQIISFLIFRLGASYILAFKFDMGIEGLIIGVAFGSFVSLILNYARFVYVRHNDKKHYNV